MRPDEEPAGAAAPATWGGDEAPLPFADLPPPAPATLPAVEPEPTRSFADDLRDLAADAQTLFEAEKAFQQARASYAVSRGKGVAARFAAAAVLGYFALIALVVGLLLALAPLITAWGALAAVTLALALAGFVAYRGAIKRLRRMRSFLSGAEPGEAKS